MDTWHEKSSIFNTCPINPYRPWQVSHWNITFVPALTPTAAYAPIPVSHHWKKSVETIPSSRRCTGYNWIGASGYSYNLVLKDGSCTQKRRPTTRTDAWNEYYSLPSSPTAGDAPTFVTEWSRYRRIRAPQGFHPSGDGYARWFDNVTVHIFRKKKKNSFIDDSILWYDSGTQWNI